MMSTGWVSFAQVKATVSLRRVLEGYGIWERLRRSGQDHYRGPCPIHQGEGRDTFHGDLGKNVFHCFHAARVATCWTWSRTWRSAPYGKRRCAYTGSI